MGIIRKLIKYSSKKIIVKTLSTLTIFVMLLLKARLVLAPAEQSTEIVKVNPWNFQRMDAVYDSYIKNSINYSERQKQKKR